MIGEFGEIQVMDWGLARSLTHDQQSQIQSSGSVEGSADGSASVVTLSNDAGDTRLGEVMGTPAYMPPEQALGRTDKTTDVFALGAILCEVLTGLPAGNDLKAAQTRLDNCQFDAKIVELAKTCIARDPASRPQDAGILAARVSAYIEATQSQLEEARLAAVRAQAVAEVERKRRRLTVALAICCSIAAVIALGSWTWISNQRLIHEQELDQQRIRARSEAEIALGEAEQLYESATAAPLLDLDDWRVAREAVTRAEALLQAGSLGPEMTQRVSNLSDMIMLGETERELVSAIDSARQDGIEASRYHLIENPALEQKALISVMREKRSPPGDLPRLGTGLPADSTIL